MMRGDSKNVEVKARTYPEIKVFIRRYALSLRPRQTESAILIESLREFFSNPKRRTKVAAVGEFPAP